MNFKSIDRGIKLGIYNISIYREDINQPHIVGVYKNGDPFCNIFYKINPKQFTRNIIDAIVRIGWNINNIRIFNLSETLNEYLDVLEIKEQLEGGREEMFIDGILVCPQIRLLSRGQITTINNGIYSVSK